MGGCKEITGGIEYPAQLVEVLIQLALRRGGRVAEGAALEMPYTGNCIAGSNPALSATITLLTPGAADGTFSRGLFDPCQPDDY